MLLQAISGNTLIMDTPSYLNFNAEKYPWKPGIDYRLHPELYQVGKGEQGVLICEPYKSEIGQFWRFKNREVASESSEKIHQQFLDYLQNNEFVGADMARKYLQMGYTRARRYANYKKAEKSTIKVRITSSSSGERVTPKKRQRRKSFIKNGNLRSRMQIMLR